MLLLRRISSDEEGTFGEMFDEEGHKLAVTCERPDNGNQAMGCIPIGDYKATRFQSPHNGDVFLVHDVPDRAMIEIHRGNTIDDTEGCILVGAAFGEVNSKKGVVGSRAALERLQDKFPTGFDLRIIEDY